MNTSHGIAKKRDQRDMVSGGAGLAIVTWLEILASARIAEENMS